MRDHEKLPLRVGAKQFEGFEDIPSDPKQEGLRPEQKYAGGNPSEIIIVDGKKYRKEISMRCLIRRGDGKILLNRPYTEREYFSHSTERVGPGPGWDSRGGYLQKGWSIADLDPRHLSDLPLYDLIPLEK